jgi:hypothetical protein
MGDVVVFPLRVSRPRSTSVARRREAYRLRCRLGLAPSDAEDAESVPLGACPATGGVVERVEPIGSFAPQIRRDALIVQGFVD